MWRVVAVSIDDAAWLHVPVLGAGGCQVVGLHLTFSRSVCVNTFEFTAYIEQDRPVSACSTSLCEPMGTGYLMYLCIWRFERDDV